MNTLIKNYNDWGILIMYTNVNSEIITIDELCEFLMIGKNTAYRLLNSGEIKAFKIGKVWKIPQDAVQKYIFAKSGLSN